MEFIPKRYTIGFWSIVSVLAAAIIITMAIVCANFVKLKALENAIPAPEEPTVYTSMCGGHIQEEE